MSSFILTVILFVQVYIFGRTSATILLPITSETNQSSTINREWSGVRISRDDYTYVTSMGAYKVHTRAAVWKDAKLICEQEDDHLAIINTESESAELKNLFLASRPYQTGSSHSHYAIIGFVEKLDGSGFVTVFDEPLEDTGFFSWAEYEPNNLYGEEHCGSIDDSGLLNDINCENKYSFICELPHDIATNELTLYF